METLEKNVKWQVSLSNGETFFESKGDYKTIAGELSPWNRLLKYISDNNLKITSMSLFTDDGQTFNLPSAGKDPKFHEFSTASKPESFKFFRKLGQNLDLGTPDDLFGVIEATYPTFVVQLWVDDYHTSNCWVLVTERKV